MTDSPPPHRTIRSFVRREGRLTPAQQRAYLQLWQRYGVDLPSEPATPIDLRTLFADPTHPLVVEIGFGNGESLLTQAQNTPQHHFIGIEVYRSGVGHLLNCIEAAQITNLKVVVTDAAELLAHHLAAESVDRLQLFFPDPWPKSRHHKRRIVQPAWLESVCRVLKRGGQLHMATDWQPYADQMLTLATQQPQLKNSHAVGQFSPRPADRPLTKFEQRGLKLGHTIFDLLFERI